MFNFRFSVCAKVFFNNRLSDGKTCSSDLQIKVLFCQCKGVDLLFHDINLKSNIKMCAQLHNLSLAAIGFAHLLQSVAFQYTCKFFDSISILIYFLKLKRRTVSLE